MTKLAIFSNGHTDVYQGKRDVKAAWMITDVAGKVRASGHSMDIETAEKTARSQNVMRVERTVSRKEMQTACSLALFTAIAKEKGFRDVKAYSEDIERRNAEHAAKMKIEVISI